MTIETKCLISPADIIGIQYECRHCHATYSIPLKRQDRVIYQCPNCHERLIKPTTGTGPREDESLLGSFADVLAAMQEHEFAAVIKLEIREQK